MGAPLSFSVGLHILIASLAVIAPVGGTSAKQHVQATVTTADGRCLLEELEHPLSNHKIPESKVDVNITLNPGHRFQTVIGFGAALTDSSAYAISRAPHHVQEALLQRLFGPTAKQGISLNMLRVSIGVTDFSVSYNKGNVSYDDVPGDFALEHFSTERDDAILLPMLRRIIAINPDIFIMASPWTAPLWLKNASTLGEGWLEDGRAIATYANYLVKYLEDYHRKGVHIHYLTLQNEPGHGGCGTMPCMEMSPEQQILLARHVTYLLRRSPNVSSTKLLAYDHNWGPNDGPPDMKQWNLWLLVCLLAPVPVIGGLCIAAFLYCRKKLRSSRTCKVQDTSTGGSDNDTDSGSCSENSSSGSSCSSNSSSRSNSSTKSSSLHKKGKIMFHQNFAKGICCGASVMVLTSWTTILITTKLYISGAIADSYFIPDFSRTFTGVNWPSAVLDSEIGHEFAGVAWHCYGGSPAEPQRQLHARFAASREAPEQHMTECSGGDWSGPFEGSLFWNQRVLFMENFNNHGQSVIHFNLALDEHKGPHCNGGACCTTCRGVVTVNSTAETIDNVTFNVEFMGLAHHSSFVNRGAHRIFSSVSPEKNVHAVAYRNVDGTIVAVVVNDDMKKNVTVQVHSDDFSFSHNLVPGVVTFKWKQPEILV